MGAYAGDADDQHDAVLQIRGGGIPVVIVPADLMPAQQRTDGRHKSNQGEEADEAADEDGEGLFNGRDGRRRPWSARMGLAGSWFVVAA